MICASKLYKKREHMWRILNYSFIEHNEYQGEQMLIIIIVE